MATRFGGYFGFSLCFLIFVWLFARFTPQSELPYGDPDSDDTVDRGTHLERDCLHPPDDICKGIHIPSKAVSQQSSSLCFLIFVWLFARFTPQSELPYGDPDSDDTLNSHVSFVGIWVPVWQLALGGKSRKEPHEDQKTQGEPKIDSDDPISPRATMADPKSVAASQARFHVFPLSCSLCCSSRISAIELT
jgi:hypothetical protein